MRLKRSKLSEMRSARLLEHFVAGTPARTAAELIGVNKNTAALFYHRLREIIAARVEDECPVSGEIEVDESYFGGVTKGKRGRGSKKIPVFGILKRGGRVYTKMVPNARAATLMPIIKAKIHPDSMVYSDCFGAYDRLIVEGFYHHRRVNHRYSYTLGPTRHINGIENFWNQAKRHLRKYNGIPRHRFHLFLKECEWRFNYGDPKQLLSTLKKWIKLSRTGVS